MIEQIHWIEHKGQMVLLADYTGLSGEALLEAIAQSNKMLLEKRRQCPLILADLTDCVIDKEVVAKSKEEALKAKSYVDKIAVVGLTGIQAVFVQVLNMFAGMSTTPFKTREEALDWLVDD